MKKCICKCFISCVSSVLFMLLNTVCFGQTYGGATGTSQDQFIINNDKSNNWGALRLQTSTDRGWTLFNEGSLSFYFENTGNLGVNGTKYMSLSSLGDLWINGNFNATTVSASNINSSNLLFVTSPYASWDHLGFSHDGNAANVLAGGADNGLAFKVSNSNSTVFPNQSYVEIMRLLPSGNVGIGTTSPVQKLDVVGNINASGNITLGGTITASSLATAGALSAASISTTGGLNAGTITSGNITSSGTITAAALSVPSLTTAGALSGSSISTSGVLSAGSISSGNVTLNNSGTGTQNTKIQLQSNGTIFASAEINTLNSGLDIKSYNSGSNINLLPATGGVVKVSGNLSSTGNITGASFNSSGALTAGTISVGNISSTGTITASAISVPSLTTSGALSGGSISTTGSVTGSTITSSGLLTAGTISSGNITSNGTISAGNGTVTAATINATGTNGPGNISTGGLSAYSITAGNLNTGGVSVNAPGGGYGLFASGASVGIGTSSPTQTLDVRGNIISSGTITASAISVPSVTTSGALSGGSISTTGALTAGTISSGNIASTGTITAASLSVPSITTSGALFGSSITTSGTISGASMNTTGNVTAGGSITGASISTTGALSSGSATLNNTGTGVQNTKLSLQSNGTLMGSAEINPSASSLDIKSYAANSKINLIPATGGSVNVTGNFSSSGSVTGASITSTGALTSGSISSGNITSTGTITAASLSVPSLTTSGALSGSSITTNGTISGASMNTTGNVTAGGSITGASIWTTGVLSSGSATLNNTGTGVQNTKLSLQSNGTLMGSAEINPSASSLDIKSYAANSKINLIPATGGSVNVTGNLSSSGSVTATSLTTSGDITSGGMITAASLSVPSFTTSGVLSAGSISTNDNISAGTISSGDITSSGNLFLTNANARMGIGTKSPKATVDINGSLNVSGNIIATNILSPVVIPGAGLYNDLPQIKVGNSSAPVNLNVESGWVSANSVQASQTIMAPAVFTGTLTAKQIKFDGSNVALGTSALGQMGSAYSVFIGTNAGTDFTNTHWENNSNPLSSNKSVFVLNNQAQLGNPLLFGTFADNSDKTSSTSPSTSMAQLAINTHHLLPNCALTVSGAIHVGPKDLDPSTFSVRDSLYNSYLLWVQKGIVSEDYAVAKVKTWSDFVFAKDYRLPDLKEVENFILTNGHLSGIPSEAEVKSNGYSINKLAATLLQKVEELTLYTIKQQKIIDLQEQQLSEQEADIIEMKKSLQRIVELRK